MYSHVALNSDSKSCSKEEVEAKYTAMPLLTGILLRERVTDN